MGQGQSSADAGDSTPQDVAVKRDYYELLGVERTATEDEIKKAYRRKALELHPDRNYGNVEDATTLFAEVQSAYEVLSDPQERAWYDSHRDVLLRGDTVGAQTGEEFSYNIKMTTADEVLKLMMKFNGRLDFSDAPGGFYGGLDEFFKKLAKEEDIACQWEDEDPLEYPEFGSKDDEYDDVVRPFYAAWTGFATRKSYAWKDQYRLSDAPDRRIRRLMEKENSKLREEAKQEYNEAVRVLVAFVRKRDPRVQNNQKSEAERQKALREAAAAQAARSRAARQAKIEELENYAVPEWAQSRTKDEHEGGFSSESDIEEHEYDCVVCDKTFKSEAQYHAHEKSKKHIKSLKQLKREMKAEGQELELEGKSDGEGVELIDENNNDDQDPTEEDTRHSKTSNSKSNKSSPPRNDAYNSETHSDNESEAKNTKSKLPPSSNSRNEEQDQASDSESTTSTQNSDYAPRKTVSQRLAPETSTPSTPSSTLPSTLSNLTLSPSASISASTSRPETPSEPDSTKPKLGKAKLKRAKKAAQAERTPTTSSSLDGSTIVSSSGGEFKCAICAAEFGSKNKLFDHIKELKHVALVSQVKGTAGAGGGAGGGKKKGKRK